MRALVFAIFAGVAGVRSNNLTNKASSSKIVEIDQGPVRGYKDAAGKGYAFYGIPYATMPVGKERFLPPLRAPTWNDTFEATNTVTKCPQLNDTSTLDEGVNCLLANVFVPLNNDTNRPVVVYIHGGQYQTGSRMGHTPLTMVAEGNIIFVNFNYRISIHGFLCLGTDLIPGNAGMKDMRALLKWVNRNIAAFGGNPNNVTLAGSSAGSAAADLLYMTESAGTLFHKVLLQSGNADSSWGVDPDPLFSAIRHANRLRLNTTDIKDLEKHFTEINITDLLANIKSSHFDSSAAFLPCLEREDAYEPFITKTPIQRYRSREFVKLPYLIGVTAMEGLLLLTTFDEFSVEMNKDFSQFLTLDLKFKNMNEKKAIAAQVKHKYFGNKTIDWHTVREFINYFGDVIFCYPALRATRFLAQAGHDEVYLYKFAYADTPNEYNITGATHSAQNKMVMDVTETLESQLTSGYKEMRKKMRQIWYDFVNTGNPTASSNLMWPSATSDSSPYVLLDSPVQLVNETLMTSDLVDFWDAIYEKYYTQPVPAPASH